MTDEVLELHRNPDVAEEVAANAVLHYLKGCGVQGEQKRAWIGRVFDRVIAKAFNPS